MFERPAVNAIVRGVQTTFWEPDNVSGLKVASSYSLEWAIPVEQSMRLLNSASVFASLEHEM
jgi:hypothetical protein